MHLGWWSHLRRSVCDRHPIGLLALHQHPWKSVLLCFRWHPQKLVLGRVCQHPWKWLLIRAGEPFVAVDDVT